MTRLIISYTIILSLFIATVIAAILQKKAKPEAEVRRCKFLASLACIAIFDAMLLGYQETAFKTDSLYNPKKIIPSKVQIDDFNKEYYRLIFQSNNAVKDTADFITMSGLKRIDSLNTRINEVNAVIDRCNKHYKSDFWNGRLYPAEIRKKPKIRNIDVSDVKISVKPQN